MKKSIIKLILFGIMIFSFTGCNKSKEQESNTNIPVEERYMNATTLDDGRIIHFALEVPYKNSDLGTALLNNEISLEDFTKDLRFVDALNDGGSKLYHYDNKNKQFGNEEFYVIVCNSMVGSKDIYVSKNREHLGEQCSIKMDDLEGVSMVIKKGTLTNVGATIVITDTSNRENIYGGFYRIDKEENGEWIRLKPIIDNLSWTLEGYMVGKDHTLEFETNWENIYGKLQKGTYRIVKDTSEAGETPTHYITAEFTIE